MDWSLVVEGLAVGGGGEVHRRAWGGVDVGRRAGVGFEVGRRAGGQYAASHMVWGEMEEGKYRFNN